MSTDDMLHLKKILTDNGYQFTKARQNTFKALINPTPQSMNDLILKSKGMVDRVSLYRNIEIFEKIGIVHRIYIGWKYKLELSDEFLGHHHHLNCLKCGNIIEIEDEKHMDEYINSLAKKYSFVPKSHQFEISGFCLNCSKIT